MGLTTRNLQSNIVSQSSPYYYEVSLPNRQIRHCGSMRDVEAVLSMYPGSLYNKVFLPHPPETVDVPYVTIKDKELNSQQILPESNLETLNL